MVHGRPHHWFARFDGLDNGLSHAATIQTNVRWPEQNLRHGEPFHGHGQRLAIKGLLLTAFPFGITHRLEALEALLFSFFVRVATRFVRSGIIVTVIVSSILFIVMFSPPFHLLLLLLRLLSMLASFPSLLILRIARSGPISCILAILFLLLLLQHVCHQILRLLGQFSFLLLFLKPFQFPLHILHLLHFLLPLQRFRQSHRSLEGIDKIGQ
mmetsp:Transcript_35128/g.59629  ORF Transcript_35128/g.59629 Transcript_35128/m.59629 type:complete len:212 (+) Transcript_35128:422-1057(+)